jgi:limonene-1,2-epoxide hydrolase
MTNADLHAKVRAHAAAWEARGPAVIKTLFTPDAQFVAPGIQATGPEQIEQAAVGYFASGLRPRVFIHRIKHWQDTGYVQWRWEETAADGAVTVFEDAIVFKKKGDLFSYWREYFDTKPVTPIGRAV